MSSGPPPLRRVGSTAQRLAEKPYEKRVCRIEAHYPPPPTGEPLDCPTPEEYVDAISAAGFEVAIVSGAFNRGTPRFPSRIFAPHPHLDQDLNPRFIELCHRRGIIVLSYYPINFSKPLRDLHPEWLMQFVDDGRPFPENQGWFCFNSPFRDWLPECLSDFMDNPYAMLKSFVVHLVRRTTAPFEIEAPEALEITAAVRPSGELMVHLINNPNPLIPWRIYNEEDFDNHRDDGAFHAPRELVPLRDIVVRFTGLEVKSARLPLQGRNLEIDSDAVLVPRVELHGVLVLEVEDE